MYSKYAMHYTGDAVFVDLKLRAKSGQVTRLERIIPLAVYEAIEKDMTDKEKLFMQFFSQAYDKCITVDKMTLQQIIVWENELELIALEAKATQQGAAKARKEREEKLSKSERDKLI